MAISNLLATPIPQNNTLREISHGHSRIRVLQAGSDRIFVTEPATGQPLADVIFVHGLSDHPGRHFHFAKALAKRGFRTTSFELEGHGGRHLDLDDTWWVYQTYGKELDTREATWRLQSGKSKSVGQPAATSSERRYQVLSRTRTSAHLEQFGRIHEWHEANFPGDRPLFLAGFSMGGLISLEMACRGFRNWRRHPKGLVLLSPALRPQGRPGRPLEGLLFRTTWELRRLPFSFLRFGFKSAFELNVELDSSWGADWMTDREEENDLFRNDPMVQTLLPSAFIGSIEAQMAVTDKKLSSFDSTALVLVPGQDGITSPAGGTSFADRVNRMKRSKRVELIQFRDICAHDLLRSSVRDQALQAVTEWMEKRMAA